MRVGIVGAGITGLALREFLAERGVEAVVLEADDEPGGVVRSVRRDGRVLDLGPQRTRLTPGVRDLVESLGIEREVREAADVPLYIYHDGALRRAPLSPRAAATTSVLSVRGKLRALLEPLAGPPREGETVEGYLRRAFGHEVAERVAGPLYAGLYASDPDEMPVEHSLAKALDRLGVERSVLARVARGLVRGRSPPPVVSFDDGMGTLPRALYDAGAASVGLGTPVRDIEPAGGGYELVTDDGGTVVDAVVLTVPAPAAASLLSGIDPASADALAELSYNPLAVVHLCADADPTGAGFQVARGEALRIRGATWNASLLGRDGVHTCFLGGADAPELVERPDERLGAIAADEFAAATGRAAEPIHVHRAEPGMPAYDRSWDALSRVDPPEGIHLAANYESRAGIPGRIRHAAALADELARPDGPSASEGEERVRGKRAD